MIMISYRRADEAGLTRALRERLVRELGADEVFIDVEGIEAGTNFRERLRDVVSRCQAMIVVIGPGWLKAGEAGPSRIEDPEDVVRFEVATALSQGVRILPVLVADARMPDRGSLPPDVRALADRNALALRHENFEADVGRLISALAIRRGHALATGVLVAATSGAAAYVLLAYRWRFWFYTAGLAGVATAFAGALLFALGPLLLRAGSAARLLGAGLSIGAWALVFLGGVGWREHRFSQPFTLTVHVQDAEGKVVRRGAILLDLEGQPTRRAEIADGEALFPGLSGTLSERRARVTPHVEGFSDSPTSVVVSRGRAVPIHLVPWATLVSGSVVDDATNRPLSGVQLYFGSGLALSTTDAKGNFTVTIPAAPGTMLLLRATRNGSEGYRENVMIPTQTPLLVHFRQGG